MGEVYETEGEKRRGWGIEEEKDKVWEGMNTNCTGQNVKYKSILNTASDNFSCTLLIVQNKSHLGLMRSALVLHVGDPGSDPGGAKKIRLCTLNV